MRNGQLSKLATDSRRPNAGLPGSGPPMLRHEPSTLGRWPTGVVWAAAIAAFGLGLVGLVEVIPSGLANTLYVVVSLVVVVSTVTVGSVLVTRLPRHIVGWLLLGGGLTLAVSTGTGALADFGLNVHPGSIPGGIWFAIISAATGGSFIGLIAGFVPLFFPTGHLPSPRWRVVLPIAIVPTVSPVVTNLFGPLTPGTYPAGVVNPLAFGGVGGQLVATLSAISGVLGVVALVLVVVSLAVRYRRAQGIERAQLKWFAYVGLVVVPTFLVAIVASGGGASGPLAILANFAWVLALGGLALLPVTIGIAVLRYRLYEIDRLISRTIAYGVVTAILAALFVAVVLAVQTVLGPVTGSNTVAVAGSTLLVAALFQPVRRRVQAIVDRRFNRSRSDAERTTAAFAGRLRDEFDLEQLRDETVRTVSTALQPRSVSIWLRE